MTFLPDCILADGMAAITLRPTGKLLSNPGQNNTIFQVLGSPTLHMLKQYPRLCWVLTGGFGTLTPTSHEDAFQTARLMSEQLGGNGHDVPVASYILSIGPPYVWLMGWDDISAFGQRRIPRQLKNMQLTPRVILSLVDQVWLADGV